ncbi:MAG: NUDIX hydrolase [Defluviitaleaceae bacterium]|nr:NUDIX hydrolase [Defluviitaleaceae bacterium]
MSDTALVSCGGLVIHRNKVLLLFKNRNGRYKGWVLPKGSLEPGETLEEAALREVKEEGGVEAQLQKYLGKTQYSFKDIPGQTGIVTKTVHWYLMGADSFHCKPQAEEFFADAGFYKQHEAQYLLKYDDERRMMRAAFIERDRMRHSEKKQKKG